MAKVDLTRALYELLLRNRQAGRRTIVFVDEAQALSREALEELRLLSNLETWQEKLLHLFLVGQPELLEKLESYNLRQLRQRVELFVQIEPMSAPETRQYIEHRIRMANPLRQVEFTDHACQRIHQISGGIPRTINILCDASLLVAYVAETGTITASHVRDAVRTIDAEEVSLRLVERRRARFWQRLWGSLAACLAVVALAAGYLAATRWAPDAIPGIRALSAVLSPASLALVHVYSTARPEDAERFAARVPHDAGHRVYLQRVEARGQTWNRVLLGGFPGLESARAAARSYRDSGTFAYARAVEVLERDLVPAPAPAPAGVGRAAVTSGGTP
jgi:general secretion pathway protein A